MSDETTLPARSEVPAEQTWDLHSIFAAHAEWEAACNELAAMLPGLAAYQGRLGSSPQTLGEYFEKYEEAARLVGKIYVYASNFAAVDTANQEAAGRNGQARSLMARFNAATAFADPELVVLGFDKLRRWMNESAGLASLAHYIDELELLQAHVRSGEVEELLAMAADPFSTVYSIYNALNSGDLSFLPARSAAGKELEVGQASMGALITHPDREVRRSAWQNYADSYLGLKNTFANTLTAAIKQDVFRARARGYESSLQASMAPSNIPVEVFHNLIEVFKKNLPTWQRYWRLRKKALGYDRLHVYDLKAPLSQAKPVVSYQQAVDWICEGMAPLGEEYASILRRGCLEERWVDRACNRGKREGAYSSGWQGTRPFILMSYAGDLFSLSTLAHELGHSLHSYFSRIHQRYIYSHYTLFAAEVASNFNQAMVRDYLFRTRPERDFQIALIEEAMSNYQRYFFIMPTLARFELEMHNRAEKGAPINADIMTGVTADLFKEGYGEEVEFDHDRIGITWAQFGHMYMNFYVYQYATGISGAHALSQGVLQGKTGAVERYLDFLKAGGSHYALDALRMAGVDLTTPEPVEQAFDVLAGLVERLERLVG